MDTDFSQTPKNSETQQPQPKRSSRVESYFELYANNIQFESSVWDLNMIFALFDQTPDQPPFKQLGAIRIPWAQAKMMAYMLSMNVAFHESANGPINVPKPIVPPDIEEFVSEKFPNDPKAKAMGERINRIRGELGL